MAETGLWAMLVLPSFPLVSSEVASIFDQGLSPVDVPRFEDVGAAGGAVVLEVLLSLPTTARATACFHLSNSSLRCWVCLCSSGFSADF